MRLLSRTIESIEMGGPICSAHLTTVLRLASAAAQSDRAPLDDGLDAAPAQVTEITQGGPVPKLAYCSRADRGILVVAEEALIASPSRAEGTPDSVLPVALLFARGRSQRSPSAGSSVGADGA
jgi:hypothetical protein